MSEPLVLENSARYNTAHDIMPLSRTRMHGCGLRFMILRPGELPVQETLNKYNWWVWTQSERSGRSRETYLARLTLIKLHREAKSNRNRVCDWKRELERRTCAKWIITCIVYEFSLCLPSSLFLLHHSVSFSRLSFFFFPSFLSYVVSQTGRSVCIQWNCAKR